MADGRGQSRQVRLTIRSLALSKERTICLNALKKIWAALKKVWSALETFFGLYLAIASFCTMFVIFIAQVFARYVLNSPFEWAFELCMMFYLWLVMLGANYTTKEHGHVVFTLIYEKMPLRLRMAASALGNLIVAVLFSLTVPLTVKYIFSMGRQVTSSLKIGLNIVYAPYLVFLFYTIVYFLVDAIKDLRMLFGHANNAEVEAFVEKGLSEYELEIQKATEGGEDK